MTTRAYDVVKQECFFVIPYPEHVLIAVTYPDKTSMLFYPSLWCLGACC